MCFTAGCRLFFFLLCLLPQRLYPQPFSGMVSAQIEIEPGRGFPQLPVARRYAIGANAVLFPVSPESFISFHPDTLLFTGIDLAPAFEAATAGTQPLALGAL